MFDNTHAVALTVTKLLSLDTPPGKIIQMAAL
jgi:hypothetical protein